MAATYRDPPETPRLFRDALLRGVGRRSGKQLEQLYAGGERSAAAGGDLVSDTAQRTGIAIGCPGVLDPDDVSPHTVDSGRLPFRWPYGILSASLSNGSATISSSPIRRAYAAYW
jgi:hypothetical protein